MKHDAKEVKAEQEPHGFVVWLKRTKQLLTQKIKISQSMKSIFVERQNFRAFFFFKPLKNQVLPMSNK